MTWRTVRSPTVAQSLSTMSLPSDVARSATSTPMGKNSQQNSRPSPRGMLQNDKLTEEGDRRHERRALRGFCSRGAA